MNKEYVQRRDLDGVRGLYRDIWVKLDVGERKVKRIESLTVAQRARQELVLQQGRHQAASLRSQPSLRMLCK